MFPVSVLSQMMQANHLNVHKVLEMANKMNLVEYMSVKYSMIQEWKLMSCSHCQDVGQQASWLLIGRYTIVNNQSEAGAAS